MLGVWVPASGGNLVGQIPDSTTGATVGANFSIAFGGNRYQDFWTFPDGSVAYPAPFSSATKIKVVRVMPCDLVEAEYSQIRRPGYLE